MAIGIGDNDPTNTPGGPGPTYGGVGEVPLNIRRVATGFGESAPVAADIMRQNMMNSWWNNFAGGLPMSMAVGNTGLNDNFGLGRTGVIGGEGGGTQIDPALAGGILGGAGGFMLGGPAGAYAGYQAGTYLGGQYGGNADPRYLGGSSQPGQPGSTGAGGTGPDPAKMAPGGQISYGGSGANAEADRLLQRGNTIGDAWQNNYGNPNAQRMAQYGNAMGAVGGMYSGAGVANGAEADAARRQQMGIGGMAGFEGSSQFGQSAMYGGRAGSDYNAQRALAGQQAQNSAMAGNAAGGMFGVGNQYGAAAQGDAASAAQARQGQQAFGALGGGYGQSQMGTSQGLLGGAAQDYQNQQGSRQQGAEAIGRLRSFYEQGPGPSAAQAQLQQASESNMSNALALARSGRGAGANAAAMRQAQFQNAATQQQTGQQMAQLRAQEAANWRGQQLSAMGQEQSALGNLRGQDLGAMGQNLGAAAQFGGLGYQGIGIGANQQNTMRGQDISSQGQNIGAQQGMYGLGFTGLGQQQQGLTGQRGQELQAYGQNIGAQQGMGALGYQGYGLGLNAAQGAGQQALTSQGQNQQTGLGYANINQQYQNIGLQNQLGYASMANQQYQSADSLRAQILNAQLQSDTARYGADRGVQVGMAQLAAQEKAALIGAIGAGVAGLSSDIRAKKDIKKPFNGLLGDLFGKKDDEEQAPGKGRRPYYSGQAFSPDTQTTYGTQAFDPSKAKGGDTFMANDRVYRIKGEAPTASFEQGISPFMQQKAAAPPGVDPRNPRRTLALDFGRNPADAYYENLDRQLDAEGYDNSPNQPGFVASDERGKYVSSDERAKQAMFRLGQLSAEKSQASAQPQTDLRPAQGYSYEYKDPSAPGAAPGTHYGPMSKDLRKTPAGRSVVSVNPETGMDQIDTDRLSLVNTSAISEQQKRMDDIEEYVRRLRKLAGDKSEKPPAKVETPRGPAGRGLGYGGI